MRVFKLQINDEKPISIGVEWGGIIIAVNVENTRESYLFVTGDESGAYRLEWVDRQLKIGDKIKLEPSDSKIVSPPFQVRLVDREDMKRRYWELKNELEEKGVLCK